MDELILIVDDNEKNVKLVRDVLRHRGVSDARGVDRQRRDIRCR